MTSNASSPPQLLSHSSGQIPMLHPHSDAWNPALNAAIIRTAHHDALLARLQSPGALVVTTGQQPGLFTGPIYTIHKALAAAALARRLEAKWNRPVVAVFWLAGDDHDFREASATAWLDTTGQLDGWQLPQRPDTATQLPMSQEPVSTSVLAGMAHLRMTLPDGPDAEKTLAWLGRHYREGATLHSAYAGALAELVAPYGVACFDATHPVTKRAQVAVLERALQDSTALDALLAGLPDSGTGIKAGDGATLVFLETEAGRDRLVSDGDEYVSRRSGDRFSWSTLRTLLHAAPERFSANVLLRPVVERVLLPTVAYVAGPGEFRYLTAQAAALYPHFGAVPQTPVPRWGGTLVEPWVERLLARLSLTAEQVLADDGTLAHVILRRDLPPQFTDAMTTLRAEIASAESAFAESGHALDPVLDRAVAGRARKLRLVADDMEQLFERHLRKRDDIAHAQWRRVTAALRPGGAPQERKFTAATFLARYGTEWLNQIQDATTRWAEEGVA